MTQGRSCLCVALCLLVVTARATRVRTAGEARQRATGILSIPCQAPCAAAAVDPRSPQALPRDCASSAIADLPARWSLPQYSPTWRATTNSDRYFGPHPRTYDSISASQVPSACNPTAWAWARLLRVMQDAIALDTNYCHHHSMAYVTPPSLRAKCDISNQADDAGSRSGGKCVCSTGGMNRANPWQGVDCSNFVSFVYNLAFGFYPTSAIGAQTCSPAAAPGRLLPNATVSNLGRALAPGDLLFITPTRNGRDPPVRVSHVVLWTGYTVDFAPGAAGPLSLARLMGNVKDKERAGMERCLQRQRAAGQPVWVIADSHFNGPAYRPFCGWYMGSFSHARRIINADASLPANDARVAYWSGASGDCMSMWAQQQ